MYVLELAGHQDALAVLEARSAATDPEVVAPGLALSAEVEHDRIRSLAFTHRVSEVVARGTGGVEAASEALRSTSPAQNEAVAVRARNVRGTAEVDTQTVERQLGDVLVAAGCTIDLEEPTHELRACFAGDTWVLGWLLTESVRDYGDRRPTDRPFFHPGAMDPLLGRAIANIGIGSQTPSESVVLDSMCGTGGILAEAGLLGASLIGSDADQTMVRGTRRNLREVLPHSQYAVLRADARQLPVSDDAVDTLLFDAPYGRQSKITGPDREVLIGGALGEAKRVSARAVVVSDQPVHSLAADVGWTIAEHIERSVHRSLTRHLLVLR